MPARIASFPCRNFIPKARAASLVILAAGLLLTIWFPVSKNRVSAPYDLVSLGLSGLAFAGIHLLVERTRAPVVWLEAWGKNAMPLYILHQLLLAFLTLPDVPGWYASAPPWLTVLQGVVLLGVLGGMAAWLDRAGRYLHL